MSDESKTPAKPAPIGLPEGISEDAVQKRKAALIAVGTNPLMAEKLAIDAEVQQAAHDARKTKQAEDGEDAPKTKKASKEKEASK